MSVKDNSEKQAAYREQLGKYKNALKYEFYFQAMLIVYAMMEDRLRSFLYYIGALRRPDDTGMNVKKTKKVLRRVYFGSDEKAQGKRIDLNQISYKLSLIRTTIDEVRKTESFSEEDEYLRILKEQYESRLDLDGFQDVLDNIGKWLDYRNEVVHGLLNKNVDCVKLDIREKVELGMSYARFIDSQVKVLKKEDIIRKSMKIKR